MYNKEVLEKEFSEYAAKNDLDININFEIIKYEKPSDSFIYFKSFVESSLKKKNNNYDIYFFDSNYIELLEPYLLNLRNELPEEYLRMFNSKVISELSALNNKLVGLPMGMSYEVLYSNNVLLNKYKKPAPKTWNELIDTCKYIMDKENDPELICYNGLFDDSELGLYSIYQFVYSCRDSYNSTFPYPQDQSFVNSLNLLKKLKNEIASDIIFSSNENFTFNKLINGKSIFIKYWLIGDPLLSILPYKISILPGLKEGISGTMISIDSIGIKKNIEKEKKDAALEVFKYYTSKEYQKKLFKNRICLTSVIELLNDEEVCKNQLCDIVKESQFTGEPRFIKERPENYRKKYKNYIYQFLYENKTVEETQKEIIDMTKIYYISLKTENSYVGLAFFIFFSIITFLMLLSLFVLFRDNFNPFFDTLPIDFWITSVLGSVIILWTPLLNYGTIETVNCHLKLFLLSIGFTFSLYPSLNLLISNFPEENKISIWICDHKYIFLLLNVLFDIIFNSITLIHPNTPKLVYIEDGENFEVCNYVGEFGIIVLIAYKIIVAILILFLTFIEWNIIETTIYLKFVVSSLYIDILSVILSFVFMFIQFKSYILYFVAQTINSLCHNN